jgi:plastocyanin
MSRRSIALVLVPFLLLVAAHAAPLVVRAGGGCHGGSDAPPGDDAASVVKIDGCMFYPTIARVPVGTTVTFINSGTAPHNVTGVRGEWGSGNLPNGARYAHGFVQVGVYPFACTLHPGMNGAIVVGGDAPAQAAPAAATVASSSAEAADPTATSRTRGTDWMPIAIAAFGGLGAGAIVGTLLAGAWLNRRRSSSYATD